LKSADQIRSAFLQFFADRGHRVVRSSSLVPEDDPTLLFANAGMNQFKNVFLGRERRDYVRAATAQKCVRAGGKHNDLENVGLTARHHTFFEMLGNFSFGDYFKKEAISLAWELLTVELGLPPDRLKATVFRGEQEVPRDAEAHAHWRTCLPADRILELGAKDNFWAMGDTGPCGPCSEVHYFQGNDHPCAEEAQGRPCLGVECECDRWLEVWNLVFMQFDRDASGRLVPLPAPCVDTGMGLERVTAVVQGRSSNYETDLFTPLIEAVSRRAGRAYGANPADDTSLRVAADHLRAMTFLVSDGVVPGNEGRGYVLRKIMRRAMRHARRLGIEEPCLFALTGEVAGRMAGAYPELRSHADAIARVVRAEEERFDSTLKVALEQFERLAPPAPPRPEKAGKPAGTLSGEAAFKLYDTYGLPLDFIEELSAERGLVIDRTEFERLLEEQRERARQASRMGPPTGDPAYLRLLEAGRTTFLGYAALEEHGARVLAVLRQARPVPRLEAGEEGEVVLDRTPFYAAAGGQVGDQGTLASDGSAAEVLDCTSPVPGLHVHHVRVTAGGFEAGQAVRATVDAHRRAGAMRHHTGTHLLHAALREQLGPHVKQAGSLVAPERLRFDFTHYAEVSPPELRRLENRVNGEVLRNVALQTREMSREDALAYGALAFFGDKYGEKVRVVEVPGFSKEFCGGTHVGRTGDVGLLLLTHEQGISAGTRRVEALTGTQAVIRAQEDQAVLEELEEAAKVDRAALVDEYARLREELKAARRENERLRREAAAAGAAGSDILEHGATLLWTPRFEGLDRKGHSSVVDDFRHRHRDRAFVVLSTALEEGGVHVIAAVSPLLHDRVKAPELLKRLDLRGGGRADFAQGGGVDPAGVDGLRRRALEVARQMLDAGA
jgi:alanyl-tRNA synthetase